MEVFKHSDRGSVSFQWAVRMKFNISRLFQKIAALALKLPQYVMKVRKAPNATGRWRQPC